MRATLCAGPTISDNNIHSKKKDCMVAEPHVQISFRFADALHLLQRYHLPNMYIAPCKSTQNKGFAEAIGRTLVTSRPYILIPSGSLISVTYIRKPWIHIPTH